MRWLGRLLDRFRRIGDTHHADPRHALGLRGEQLAERWLTQRGMRCIDRRYRGPMGELDLVMEAGRTVVFVEVKTQTSGAFNDPHERVTTGKQRKLIRVAKAYLLDKRLTDRPCRFDVVSVTLTEPEPRVEHFADAFRPREMR